MMKLFLSSKSIFFALLCIYLFFYILDEYVAWKEITALPSFFLGGGGGGGGVGADTLS